MNLFLKLALGNHPALKCATSPLEQKADTFMREGASEQGQVSYLDPASLVSYLPDS